MRRSGYSMNPTRNLRISIPYLKPGTRGKGGYLVILKPRAIADIMEKPLDSSYGILGSVFPLNGDIPVCNPFPRVSSRLHSTLIPPPYSPSPSTKVSSRDPCALSSSNNQQVIKSSVKERSSSRARRGGRCSTSGGQGARYLVFPGGAIFPPIKALDICRQHQRLIPLSPRTADESDRISAQCQPDN